MNNFQPIFKELDENNQYYYDNGNWIKCSENIINSLWNTWVVSKYAERQSDKDGYIIYGYLKP